MKSDTPPAPRIVGGKSEVDVSGMLMGWVEEKKQPAMLSMPGSDLTYLPLFNDAAQLRRTLGDFYPDMVIKQISDGQAFIDSLVPDIAPIVNLRVMDDGKVRFTQLFPEGIPQVEEQ